MMFHSCRASTSFQWLFPVFQEERHPAHPGSLRLPPSGQTEDCLAMNRIYCMIEGWMNVWETFFKAELSKFNFKIWIETWLNKIKWKKSRRLHRKPVGKSIQNFFFKRPDIHKKTLPAGDGKEAWIWMIGGKKKKQTKQQIPLCVSLRQKDQDGL